MKQVKLIPLLLLLVILLTACGGSGSVMTVEGVDISYDTYRYFYLNYKAQDADATEEELHQSVVDAISTDVAITLLAQEQNVGLNKQERKAVDDYVEATIANYGGKTAYLEALEKNYLTEDLFSYLYSQQMLENKLREYYYLEMNDLIKSDDATFEADLKENFMAAKQVLIRHDNGSSKEANKALAEGILTKALAGEDFDSLIEQYSEDTSAASGYVYHFTYGQMVQGFEDAVSETAVGSVCSYVAESEAGYHVVMRVEMDAEYVNNHFEELRDAYKARRFNEIRDSYIESFTVEKSKDFDDYDFNE